MLMRKTALGIALLLLPLSLLVNGQNPEWQAMKTQKLFAFDPDCADKVSFPKQALGKIVQEAIPRKDRGRPEDTYGDLAVAIKLRKQGPTVYFVPTVCGTGNCTWLLYTISPVKSLGEIKGSSITTYQSLQGLPMIVVYKIVDTFTSSLSTYSYSAESGKYEWLGDNYVFNGEDGRLLNGEGRIPTFLTKAKRLMPQCKESGG